MEATRIENKKLAQQYVQELLLKVEQIDGKDSREHVKSNIQDAGKDFSKLKMLVRELTTDYAPELMDRWEDIVRKIDVSRPPTPTPLLARCVAENAAGPRPRWQPVQLTPLTAPHSLCRQIRPTPQLQDRRQ